MNKPRRSEQQSDFPSEPPVTKTSSPTNPNPSNMLVYHSTPRSGAQHRQPKMSRSTFEKGMRSINRKGKSRMNQDPMSWTIRRLRRNNLSVVHPDNHSQTQDTYPNIIEKRHEPQEKLREGTSKPRHNSTRHTPSQRKKGKVPNPNSVVYSH